MLQLHNSTAFAADIVILPNEDGIDTLYVMAKAEFHVENGRLMLVEPQSPLKLQDEYQDTPHNSSLKWASDYHLCKSGTDVVILGDCINLQGNAIKQCDVDVHVGALHKTVRVFGDRIWQGDRMSEPRPFQRMPILYENAFGGRVFAADNQVQTTFAANPVGLGFAGGRNLEQMQGERLPNVEDPSFLIQNINDEPMPAALGAIAPFWSGRAQFVGTYDEQWEQERAPYLPADFNRQFFRVASPGLKSEEYFLGGESVFISNMWERGDWAFNLPAVALYAHVTWRQKQYKFGLNIETVYLQPNISQVSMTWRGSFAVNQFALQVEEVQLKMQRQLSAAQ